MVSTILKVSIEHESVYQAKHNSYKKARSWPGYWVPNTFWKLILSLILRSSVHGIVASIICEEICLT